MSFTYNTLATESGSGPNQNPMDPANWTYSNTPTYGVLEIVSNEIQATTLRLRENSMRIETGILTYEKELSPWSGVAGKTDGFTRLKERYRACHQ
jgi:hypothetical protein